ncbi:DUF4410 domain-containing protein [Trinickia violacea]|uniref:DUF4410 domain-containing protein n=1 Tax=Trinickia violacea TaxID=2571746 RepID=A0A4P8ITL2_9BURK|nr:DUF4410 domain-containing protein [Trinickia violacea]QCP52568.1 DUF4410 domain-containing protein [Trinickia violacea]
MTRLNIVLTSFEFVGKKAARCATVALTFGALLLGGCASGITNQAQYSAQPQLHPDSVYVYTFRVMPDQVKLDTSGVAQKLKAQMSGASPEAEQAEAAMEVREALTSEVVQKLQAMGLRVIRSDSPPPADQNVLIVQGSVSKADEGNRRRRVVIGLGAGKSEVAASVQVLYKQAGGAPMFVQSFDASADSGKMPGVAETAGVGAAAGHVATSAAVGGGLHGIGEVKHATLTAVSEKLADKIAKQVGEIGVSQGWMAADRVK